jgi:Zn-finger nucleic acid-binding protein
MSTDKPSRTEEDYFTKRDLELLQQKRDQLEEKADRSERQQHFMKCPKCGADLHAEEFHGVTIDRCPECNGIWLDSGEIDSLMTDTEPGLLGRVFGDMTAALRERKSDDR